MILTATIAATGMRVLASVQTVDAVSDIPKKDRLGLAKVKKLGWHVLVNKQEIHPGQQVVFFEVDSALPYEDSRFNFLKDKCTKTISPTDKVLVVKTMKMCGYISQGLIMPIALFPEIRDPKDGLDVTTKLNVRNWSDLTDQLEASQGVDECVSSKALPAFIPVTRQERIQSDPEIIDNNRDRRFSVQHKADGSSMSVFFLSKEIYPEQFGVTSHHRLLKQLPRPNRWQAAWQTWKSSAKAPLCTRIRRVLKVALNYQVDVPAKRNKFLEQAEKLHLREVLSKIYEITGRNLIFQGELVGPGVQGNRDQYLNNKWLLFDIYDLDNKMYLLPREVQTIYYELLQPKGIDMVHCIADIQLFEHCPTVDELVSTVSKMHTLHLNPLEGLVCKSVDYPYVHFKVLNPEYLLKNS